MYNITNYATVYIQQNELYVMQHKQCSSVSISCHYHATKCSCKLSSISLQVTLSVNTINTRQNRIKVGNPRHLTAGTSYIAGHQGKLGQIENI